jgi:catechol 2,3-dioxygenase-like lactoylglutathione lyase family enzyme
VPAPALLDHLLGRLVQGSTVANWYARPVFFVADCERALRFYVSLGFREAWRHEEGGILVALQVDRPDVELILNRNAQRAGGGRLFMSLARGEVASSVAAFAAAGVEVRDEHWGMPVKAIRDADGNDLLFVDDDLVGA